MLFQSFDQSQVKKVVLPLFLWDTTSTLTYNTAQALACCQVTYHSHFLVLQAGIVNSVDSVLVIQKAQANMRNSFDSRGGYSQVDSGITVTLNLRMCTMIHSTKDEEKEKNQSKSIHLVSNRYGIITHQIVSYLSFICKRYESSKFYWQRIVGTQNGSTMWV